METNYDGVWRVELVGPQVCDVRIREGIVFFKCFECGKEVGQNLDDFVEMVGAVENKGLYCFPCSLKVQGITIRRVIV